MHYKTGNLITEFKKANGKVCLLHQANCQFHVSNRHGKGVAYAIAKSFPEMGEAENLQLRLNPQEFYFGTFFSFEQSEDKFIVNLFSQKKFGSPEGIFDDYVLYGTTEEILKHPNQGHLSDTFSDRCLALQSALIKFKETFNKKYKVLIPLIASGVAKHSSKKYLSDVDYFKKYIAPIIENALVGYDVTVVIFDK